MATARLVEEFLKKNNVSYDLVAHRPTPTSLQSAKAAHIDARCLAKAVVLEDTDSRYVMAVLPADRHLQLGALREQLGRPVGLATEAEVTQLFADCHVGAIPPLGSAYGLETVFDDSLAELPEIYFEAGDHEHLVHMKTPAFMGLLGEARHGRFSAPA